MGWSFMLACRRAASQHVTVLTPYAPLNRQASVYLAGVHARLAMSSLDRHAYLAHSVPKQATVCPALGQMRQHAAQRVAVGFYARPEALQCQLNMEVLPAHRYPDMYTVTKATAPCVSTVLLS